jgi:hypothetical protein
LKLLVANTDIGPAKIAYMEIAGNGKPIRDWDELFEAPELQASNAADALYRERHRIGLYDNCRTDCKPNPNLAYNAL